MLAGWNASRAVQRQGRDAAKRAPAAGRTIRMNTFWLIVAVVLILLVITATQHRRHVEETEHRLCRSCGAAHPSFARFCRRCGRAICQA